MLHLLFPSHPLFKTKPDDIFKEQFLTAKEMGINCSVFNTDELKHGKFNPFPKLSGEELVVYRGWMLSVSEYEALEKLVASCGAKLNTTTEQYKLTHYLPEWYPILNSITPETVFADNLDQVKTLLLTKSWKKFFVKDYVKSLTTARGSVATNLKEIDEIIQELTNYRGCLEGGVCIREYENFLPFTESRFFICGGFVYGTTFNHPPLLYEIASKIQSPFYSVDLVIDNNRNCRLIEIGDGQVSDLKDWSAKALLGIIRENIK